MIKNLCWWREEERKIRGTFWLTQWDKHQQNNDGTSQCFSVWPAPSTVSAVPRGLMQHWAKIRDAPFVIHHFIPQQRELEFSNHDHAWWIHNKPLIYLKKTLRLYLSAWSAEGWGRLALTPPGPSAQWAVRGNPSLGCSGPGVPLASQSGSECPSGPTGSNDTDFTGHWSLGQCVRHIEERAWSSHLIQCMSYMWVSIGIRWSIMNTELLLGLSGPLPGIQICKSTLLWRYGEWMFWCEIMYAA